MTTPILLLFLFSHHGFYHITSSSYCHCHCGCVLPPLPPGGIVVFYGLSSVLLLSYSIAFSGTDIEMEEMRISDVVDLQKTVEAHRAAFNGSISDVVFLFVFELLLFVSLFSNYSW
ncbi:hypothetical protein VNO78_14406 [Psophocarpus tetragonolobus]|uniref:Uncharacterized protein n=1 Tax=Psophocarpus tetragonolobus TaxID=3891 RepID=A0AAN9SRD8_PSOTE